MAGKKKDKPIEAERLPAPVGAPTKFKPEYTQRLLSFFDVEPYFKDEAEQSIEFGKDGKPRKAMVKYRLLPNKLPTLFRFARDIDVAYSTVWRWAEKGEDPELQKKLELHIEGKETLPQAELEKLQALKEFCNAYNEAKQMQKEFLINIGLAGAAPPAAFIFTAKNITDMRDERVTEHKIADFTELIKQKLEARRRNNLPDTNRS